MRITDEIINDRAAVEKSLKAHKEAMKILEEKKQLLDSELIAKKLPASRKRRSFFRSCK